MPSHRNVVLAFVLVITSHSNSFGDAPKGAYSLVLHDTTSITDNGNHPIVSCGHDGRHAVAQLRRLEVIYDGNISVNGGRWTFVSVSRDELAQSDVAVATQTLNDSGLILRLGVWRRDGKARAALVSIDQVRMA